MKEICKLLIVDDSLIFRYAVAEALKDDPEIRIVGSVRNGVLAMEFIKNNHVDIVTLDVEMPEKGGIETLMEIRDFNKNIISNRILNAGLPIGVIMLSSLTRKGADTTIHALELGALDFVLKPQANSEEASILMLKNELLPKIRQHRHNYALKVNDFSQFAITPEKPQFIAEAKYVSNYKAIAIGVSTGGPKALAEMLPELCNITNLPIIIVQHMPEHFTQSLAESLDRKCSHAVKEAENHEIVRPGHVYIAKGNKHLLIGKDEHKSLQVILNDQPPENGCRPSVDVFFRSLPDAYNGDCIAIIMTGMGSDGAKSLRSLKRSGACILAQDEDSSVVWGMPGCAVATGFVDEIVPLADIPHKVKSIINVSST